MFENLSKRLSQTFASLRKKGALSEADVNAALREIRIALLEADVALSVAKAWIADLKPKLIGRQVTASVNPAQMVIKLVHDALIELLGSDVQPLNLNAQPPAVILMLGLQGSGKTTSTAKLGRYIQQKLNKKTFTASLDIYRPAAQEQLATVSAQAGIESLPIIAGEKPAAITKRALKEAALHGADVLLLDTAGRLHIDEELMQELQEIKRIANPIESLLVADALTGQDAANIAKNFHEIIGISGLILTRMDGDGRGGAALSMQHITGQPIKFVGVGEDINALEVFDPSRMAGRILEMGDVVALVERAQEAVSEEDAQKMAKRMESGQFDMDDFLGHMRQIQNMGGIGGVMNIMPGMGKIKNMMADKPIDESVIAHQEAIILSMTKAERKNPKLLNASRKRRVAKGSGTNVQAVNRTLKQHQQMAGMMKKVKKFGLKGMMNPAKMSQLFGGMR
jgi:signal recognition particle subunit SRP54